MDSRKGSKGKLQIHLEHLGNFLKNRNILILMSLWEPIIMMPKELNGKILMSLKSNIKVQVCR